MDDSESLLTTNSPVYLGEADTEGRRGVPDFLGLICEEDSCWPMLSVGPPWSLGLLTFSQLKDLNLPAFLSRLFCLIRSSTASCLRR